MKKILAPLLVVLASFAMGCTGAIGDPSGSWTASGGGGSDGGSDAAGDATGTPNADAAAVDPDGTTTPDVPAVDPCQGAIFGASAAPIRRLSQQEYNNTIAALFPGVTLPAAQPLADERIDGFMNNVGGQSVSPLGVQTYVDLAQGIAEAAANQLAVWAPCSDDSDSCASDVMLHLGPLAYRRPLETEEATALTTFVTGARAEHGFLDGVAMGIQVLLESPFFLFRPEFGTGTAVGDGAVSLDAYEMASRLSYFFLQTMPDQTLFDAAANGTLTDPAVIEQQARRLLDDPRARPVLTGFFSEWLRVYKLDELALDPATFPEFDTQLVADFQESLQMYLDKALWEDDSYGSLFGGTYAFVNDRLAPLYGLEPPGTDAMVEVELDPAERRGVLTQVGLLASTSHGITHSPIFRGVTMLSNILCTPSDPVPDGLLDGLEPLEVDPDDICTTRDYFAMTHNRPGCHSCHDAIDGAGYTFENYDALGRFRTTENGCDIDASGDFPTTDFGAVDGAVELAQRIVDSPQVADCMATHLFRFGFGRSDSEADLCEIRAMSRAMLDAGGSLQELVIELVKSPSFRSRPAL